MTDIRYTFGHYLSQSVRVNGHRIRLTPLENDLFFVLYVNMDCAVSDGVIADILYGHREDGGPLWMKTVIRKLAHCLRRKTGLDIRPNYRGQMILNDPKEAFA